MSLYSFEEVCNECIYSHWHFCDECYGSGKFCHCEENHENSISFTRGECEYKEIKDG